MAKTVLDARASVERAVNFLHVPGSSYPPNARSRLYVSSCALEPVSLSAAWPPPHQHTERGDCGVSHAKSSASP
eukprot:3875659-Rhodomonas_salina.1